MGIRHPGKQEISRLKSKSLDEQFRHVIMEGLGCSPFEAEAILNTVKEIYFPNSPNEESHINPGQIKLICVSSEEPAGKPIKTCEKVTVYLTIHRGIEDDTLLQKEGPHGFRQTRIPELCQEAFSQGGILTREDLAYRIFFVSTRTITRDLKLLRETKSEIPVPLRSTLHDIGPMLTHRVRIVRLSLEGKSFSEICTITHHSPQAVKNYLNLFNRCTYLINNNFEVGQIAFLLKRGRKLIEQYLELLKECESDKIMRYHLEEIMRLGNTPKGKKNNRHPRIS